MFKSPSPMILLRIFSELNIKRDLIVLLNFVIVVAVPTNKAVKENFSGEDADGSWLSCH